MTRPPRHGTLRGLCGPALMALALGSACGDGLEVEVNTNLGPRPRGTPGPAQWSALGELAQALTAAGTPDDAVPGPAVAAHPPTGEAELDGLLAALRQGPLDDLAGPAQRIAASPRGLWPRIKAELLAPRKAPKTDYRSLLTLIGGDVPNRYGHFDLAWKQAHGYSVKRSEDWFGDLLALSPDRVPRALAGVYRDCIVQAALLQASGRIGRAPELAQDVTDTLLAAAEHHHGTFQDEVSRAIVSLGDEAVVPLLRAALLPEPGDGGAQRADYAADQLDRMDRWQPDRAEAALAPEPRRLLALLEVWGAAKQGDAAALLLRHADARNPRIRFAARAGFLALVRGPAPQATRRTVRLIGGGTSTARAHLTYRQQAAVAIREAMATAQVPGLEPPCEPVHRGDPADPTCGDQPARLTHAYFAWLDGRRRQAQDRAISRALAETDTAQALQRLDGLLTESLDPQAIERVASVYRRGAQEALVAGDPSLGAQLSRKAAVLLADRDPDTSTTLQVQALLAEASLADLPPWGRDMLVRSAAQLRPKDPLVARVRGELPALRAGTTTATPRHLVLGSFAVMLGLGCLGAVARRGSA